MADSILKYQAAVVAWREAVDEMDQAHAALRDAGLHKYHTGYGSLSADSLVDRAMQLLKSLEQLTCDDCGEPVATHAGSECPYWE